MLFRDRLAIHISPLFIRLALAATFIWAGAGKLFFKDMEVQGQQAAILANMGLSLTPTATPPSEAPPDEATPEEEAPETTEEPEATETPEETEEPPPAESPAEPPAEEAAPEETPEETEPPAPAEPPMALLVQDAQNEDGSTAPGAGAPQYTAEQFPTPTPVRRVYGVALLLHRAGHPGDNGGSALLPAPMTEGMGARLLAWVTGLTEFFGGIFIAIGMFTRLWALGLAVAMGMALWLTQIGPVVLGGAPGTLGVLPAIDQFRTGAWRTFLWQLALWCGAMSMLFSGPGALAFDTLFAPRRHGGKPKHVPADAP